MLKKFFDLIGLIEDRFLKKFIVLVFLSLLSAPIEILGLGLIIPIFVSLSGGENEILIFLKNYFHFEDKNEIIIFLIFSFLFLNLFRFCFIFYLNNEQLKFRNILTENISSSLFQRYLYLNFNKFKKTNPEVLSKNLIYEVSEIVNNGIYQIILIITDLIVLSSIVFFLMYQNFEVTLILILTLSFLFFTYIFFLKNKIKALSNLKFEMMSHRYSRAYEGLQSYIDIRLNKNEKVFLDTYSKDSYNFFNSTRKLTLTQIMPRYFFELVLIFFGSVLILASYKNNIEVNKLFSLLALYGFASLRLIPLISRLVFSINASSIAHVSFSKLKTDLKIKQIINLN